MSDRHTCPAPFCNRSVHNSKLACLPHWSELSPSAQREIYRTAGKPVTDPVRLAALKAALIEWRQIHGSPAGTS